ncbi:MAG: hypothetical protein ACUVQL_05150 [Candidatus Bathycorpusculaceae bacterium]
MVSRILGNKWALASLTILCWAIAATFSTGYFYYQYADLVSRTKGTSIHVNLGINYGNGTVKWFNNTEVKMGITLLNLTEIVAKVNYTLWPGMGTFVDSIDNVENSPPYYWMWWVWTSYGWMEGPIACDKYLVSDGEALYWYYEDTSVSPLPTPP